jgi:hypothetical protein
MNNNGFWIGWLDSMSLPLQSLLISITTAHKQWLSKTPSILSWTTGLLYSNMTDKLLSWVWVLDITTDDQSASLCWNKVTLLGLTTRFLLLSDSWAFVDMGSSLTRGRVCRLELLLVLASAVFFMSVSYGTHDHILLSQIPHFPFRWLLRYAGLRLQLRENRIETSTSNSQLSFCY